MGRMTVKEIEERAREMGLNEAVEWINQIKDNYGVSVARLADKYNTRVINHQKEMNRLEEMMKYERKAKKEGFNWIGGIDEAGRGPLAGPVVAACVILPENLFIEKLDDSKKLSPAIRDKLYNEIRKNAVTYGLGIVEVNYIDKYNILNATKKAMSLAVEALTTRPGLLIIDAVKLEKVSIPQWSITKGDSLSVSVAAASILAKVTRDRIIVEMDKKYPGYGLAKNKGYGTSEHMDAIRKYGLSPIHRRSFTKNIV